MALNKIIQTTVSGLLDTYGLENTWYALLRAFAKSSESIAADAILRTSTFKQAPIAPNLLVGLSIGEVSVLYEYSLAFVDTTKRKGAGQYFTPDDVSQFLASHFKLFSSSAVWLDPCAGVGNLSYWLIKEQGDPENFLIHNLYLIDKDPLALCIARTLLSLNFAKTKRDLFSILESRFLSQDFLLSTRLPKTDVAILNPPYVSHSPTPHENFLTSKTGNMYAYFIERVATLCKDGYISITPQTFTNAKSFKSLREVVLANHNTIDVYCFDNVPDNIFTGIKFGSDNTNKANSTRAGIIVARNTKQPTHRITPMLRWRSHERTELFKKVYTFLAPVTLTPDIFPKVDKGLSPLYTEAIASEKKLGDMVSKDPTKYFLQIPSTPRYFISANKTPVTRTSFKTLYFHTKEDLDFAYLLLNSSYMYWWWRVNDGGMTLSEQTLMNLPIPSIGTKGTEALLHTLEQSEKRSMVTKKNAGKIIENIKHPTEIIDVLTKNLFPKHADALRATHLNSHFGIQKKQLRLTF